MMYKFLGVAFQSTSGYVSSINGKAEAPHRTIKKTARSMLMGANMSDEYWCFFQVSMLQMFSIIVSIG